MKFSLFITYLTMAQYTSFKTFNGGAAYRKFIRTFISRYCTMPQWYCKQFRQRQCTSHLLGMPTDNSIHPTNQPTNRGASAADNPTLAARSSEVPVTTRIKALAWPQHDKTMAHVACMVCMEEDKRHCGASKRRP
jgi:hypothetical protein